VLSAGTALAAPATTGPVATYWMSASTATGLAAMGSALTGGGKRPGLGSMMGMAMRGGLDPSAVVKTLTLQLGSRDRPLGPPQAEHDPPQGLGVGPSLALLTPQPSAPSAHVEEAAPSPPAQYQQPKGRLLIFWGCGEHAAANQPLVIDFATLGQEGGARQMMGLLRSISIARMQPPSPATQATYGEWPNAQSRVTVPATGSLQGAHTVTGDYSPAIQFNLGPDQDFLAPLQLTANQRNLSGSANLAWGAVDRSQGYFASMFGAAGGGEVVMWTSSSSQAPAFGFPDYLANGEIHRLVGAGVLMPPAQTSCVVPEEVAAAAGRAGFFTLAAYGGESDIAFPPRPPAPRPWNIAWTVKVRYRSSTSGILGSSIGQQQRQGHSGILGGILP